MTLAVGIIETLGLPAAMEAADAMAKGARVEVVRMDTTDAGLISIIVRGPVAEVSQAITAGCQRIRQVEAGTWVGHHMVPCPDGQEEAALPLLRRQRDPDLSSTWLD
ncbi:Carbon dioxide-concentrating mechanism protein CcmK [Halomicronema hongdechloris C2206]|uniref:Carbon dioxide-concentrating mechanism protein CcmK n=1 Tax=Halomicronema hongdechloris C2206 TaxID=1641165 RepID=A0A1Z3HTY6_9CYAN|nr:BMC domain-containing protein [Halomicronema hongdechloris]ASC73791.1 Carbon dioxide-concentrating mechanism protein CcmK [Halomicronema hongdechloris C2206]